MNEELNKKLAEWVGFRRKKYRKPVCEHSPRCEFWTTPRGVWIDHTPNFTQSLDACVEWLVPKLVEWSINNNDENLPSEAICAEIAYYDRDRKWITAYEFAETPTLALCLAISKLIEEEVD